MIGSWSLAQQLAIWAISQGSNIVLVKWLDALPLLFVNWILKLLIILIKVVYGFFFVSLVIHFAEWVISSSQNALGKQECSWISLNLGTGKEWESFKVFLCGILDSRRAVCQPDMAVLFFKKTFDKPTSVKRRICGVPEHYESLGCLKILSFTFEPQWLFVCVCFLYFSD